MRVHCPNLVRDIAVASDYQGLLFAMLAATCGRWIGASNVSLSLMRNLIVAVDYHSLLFSHFHGDTRSMIVEWNV